MNYHWEGLDNRKFIESLSIFDYYKIYLKIFYQNTNIEFHKFIYFHSTQLQVVDGE